MTDRPRLLDLFCGAGGTAVGFHRAGFAVVGVDIVPQPRYPFPFILGDALDVLARMIQGERFLASDGKWYGLEDFAVIAAAPPCQRYCMLNRNTNAEHDSVAVHVDLVAATRRSLQASGKIWVIENVQGAPLQDAVIVCGHALGLLRLARHRHFESSVMLFGTGCTHRNAPDQIGIYGSYPDGARVSPYGRNGHTNHRAASLQEAREAMGIDWMAWRELTQAIPPAYTEFIGKQLLAAATPA